MATSARYRTSTAGSAIAAATAVRPASSSRRTGTRSPAPGSRQHCRTVAALLAVAAVGLVTGEPQQPRRLPDAQRVAAPLNGVAQGQALALGQLPQRPGDQSDRYLALLRQVTNAVVKPGFRADSRDAGSPAALAKLASEAFGVR